MTLTAQEIERLRKAQAAAVMPLIGPLLDAWEYIPNDVSQMDELVALKSHIEQISNVMETAQ